MKTNNHLPERASHEPVKLAQLMEQIDYLQGHLPQPSDALNTHAVHAAPETVGDRILAQLRKTNPGTLPIPSDFKALPTGMLQRIRPLSADGNPGNGTALAVRTYLQAIGISVSTAQAFGLGFLQHDFERESAVKDEHGNARRDKLSLPAVVYLYTVNGRTVSAKARSCAVLHEPTVSPPRVDTAPEAPVQTTPETPVQTASEASVQTAPKAPVQTAPLKFTKDWTQLTCNPALGISPYHIDCINPQALQGKRVPVLILTEGEKDCLALYEAGFAYCISVPTGAKSRPEKVLAPFVDWFRAVDNVVLCGDTDLPGREMVDALSQFFGSVSRRVQLPDDCKDIADVLLLHGKEAVREVINHAWIPQLEHIVTVDDLRTGIHNYLCGNYDHGYDLGYGPLTDRVFRLTDAGGLIVVTGQAGCGKSSFMRDLLCHLMMHHNCRCLCFSFEDPDPNKNFGRLARICLGTNQPQRYSRDRLDACLHFLNTHIVMAVMKGDPATSDFVYNLADSYYRRCRFQILLIDPYACMDHSDRPDSERITETVKSMLRTLQSWGQAHGVWVIIVAHPRKVNTAHGGLMADDVSPDDIADSAHWKNLADYLFALKRVNQPDMHYTELNMLKVRDQEICVPGKVYYVRQAWGAFKEMASPEECEKWYRNQQAAE